jgi:NAD kinase
MNCQLCNDGYYPAVNVNGVVIHRTEPTVVVARIVDEKIVPVEHIYSDGIVVCTRKR